MPEYFKYTIKMHGSVLTRRKQKCPVCGEVFLKWPQSVYRECCSYHCMRKKQREREELQRMTASTRATTLMFKMTLDELYAEKKLDEAKCKDALDRHDYVLAHEDEYENHAAYMCSVNRQRANKKYWREKIQTIVDLIKLRESQRGENK